MSLTAATLFSGIGAPETAMPGWQWAWSAEIEKFPAAVHAERHADSKNLGDVSADDFTERAEKIHRPDVLVFGSPCQSFSVAGKHLGLDDPRGNLAVRALSLVGELRPEWFIFENVPGLLSSDEGRDFGSFLGIVAELGYGWAYRILDAQYFGVAQRRRRVFVVGHLGDWRCAGAVLFEPESLRRDTPPRREAGERPATTIASRPTGGGGLGTDFDCDGGLIASHEVAQPLLAKANCSMRADAESYVAHSLRGDGFDASEDGTGRGTPIIPILEAGARTGKSTDDIRAGIGIGEAGDPMFTLQSGKQHAIAFQTGIEPKASEERAFTLLQPSAGGGVQPQAVAYQCHGTNVGPMGVLRQGSGGVTSGVPFAVALRGREGGATAELSDMPSALRASCGGGDKAHVLTSMVRRLTPRECERLQGFPDDYTLIEYRNKPAADGPRYKALGNSMAVPVMRWILSRVELAEKAA